MANLLKLNSQGQVEELNSLSIPDYIQSSIPVAPAHNQVWVEINANQIISTWIWDNINTRWVDLYSRTVCSSTYLLNSNTSSVVSLEYPVTASNSILIDSLTLDIITSVAQTSVNRWTISFDHSFTASTTSLQSFDTFGIVTAANTRTKTSAIFSNLLTPNVIRFFLTLTRFNSGGNIRCSGQILYRTIRA